MKQNTPAKRFLSRMRSDFPVAGMLLFFMMGQALAFFLYPVVFLSLSVFLALFLWWQGYLLKNGAMLVPFVIGGLSLALVLPPEQEGVAKHSLVNVTVLKEPRRRQAESIEFLASVDGPERSRIDGGSRAIFRGRDLPWLNASRIQAGVKIALRASCTPVKRTLNPFSYDAALLRQRVSYTCEIHYASSPFAVRETLYLKIRQQIYDLVISTAGNTEDTGLFLSMFLGIPDCLSERTEKIFKQVGLTHILVVSGYQVTLIYYFIRGLFYWLLRLSPRVSFALPIRAASEFVGLSAAVFYIFMCGLEPAVMRAGIAICLLVAGRCSERGDGMLHAILVTLCMVCLISPCAFFEPGTQLTFAALCGICLGIRATESPFKQYLKSCIYASLLTSMVSVCWFGIFSPVSFLLNPVLAAPISALVCQGGILAILLTAIGFDAHGFILRCLTQILHYFKLVVGLSASVPCAYFSCSLVARILAALLLTSIIALILRKRIREYLVTI